MKKILLSIFIYTTCIFPQTTGDIYNDAMRSFNSRQYAETVSILKNFLQGYQGEDEIFASATYYIAESFFNLQQNSAAVPYYEYLVNNQKWTNYRDISLFRLGIIYFEDSQYEKSRQSFRRLLSLYPNNENQGPALYWIGESFVREGRTDEAVKFLEDAVDNKKNNKYIDNAIFSLASAYESKGDYENAVKYYDMLLSFHRNSPLAVQAQIRIGICYFKLKDYESSILELNNPMLGDLPENLYSESLYLLANSYFRVESYDEAEKIYREILERYPDSENIREVNYGLAWSLFQQNEYGEAYSIFNNLAEGDDSLAEKSFFWKAETKRYAGKTDEAMELYKQFLEEYPNSSYKGEIEFQMGALYYTGKQSDIAERYLASSLKSNDPQVNAKARTLKGEIELNKKNYIVAKNNFDEVLNIVGEKSDLSYRALLGLGIAQYYMKNYQEGIKNLTNVASAVPEFEKAKVQFYLAENLYASGKYQDAINHYNQVVPEEKELHKKALYGKAYSYFNSGRYDQAASLFSDYLKKYPGENNIQDARIRLADSYYGSKNYPAASRIYSELFASGQIPLNNPNAYYQYAQSLYRGGKIDEAIARLFELREKFPQSDLAPRAYYLVGWIYFQRNEYEKAIEQYKNTITLYPSGQAAPIAYYSIGDAYYNLAKYDSAIVNYERILSLYPGSPNVFDALNGIQYAYIAMNRPEQAVEKIEDYLSQHASADFADQLSFKRGEIYYSNRSYENAKNGYKSFLNNYKNSKLVPDAYFWIGKSAQNLGQYEEAVYNYNRVVELYPKSQIAASAVIELSTLYNQRKNYDASIRILDKIISLTDNESPRKSEFLFHKGITLSQKGDIAGALDTYDEIAMYYKNSLFADKAKFEHGMLDFNSKNYPLAEKYFRELSETRSDDLGAKAQFFYGETLFMQNKISEAITAFVRVRSVFSGYEEWLTRSYLRLGDSYIKLNEPKQAAEMYRAVISRNRGDKYGEEAQKKLRAIK